MWTLTSIWFRFFAFQCCFNLISNLTINIPNNIPNNTISHEEGIASYNTAKSLNEFDWPVWCRTQQNSKNCGGYGLPRNNYKFYYDVIVGGCRTFLYGLCGNNPNQFERLDDCYQHCNVSYLATDTVKAMDYSTICLLQPEQGSCVGYENMYYYNVNARKCVSLSSGYCGGNLNRFNSKSECSKNCNKEILKASYRKVTFREQKFFDSEYV